ncbi:12051_t:CDS:2 [Racocetra fulgida]|uniref:12051_t:CDS:1 n=1 Tax=Racocetra fulgida TaxID=60492 RepID=A0A9N9F787_9GLOM|nr:12051_t:CDS:2 [Racocetra fulgida]
MQGIEEEFLITLIYKCYKDESEYDELFEHDADLWNAPIVRIPRPSISTKIQTSNFSEMEVCIEEQISSDEKNSSNMSFEETLEDIADSEKAAEISDDSLEKLLYSNTSSDPDDVQGATLDDALDKLRLDAIEAKVNFLKTLNETNQNFIEELSQLIPALDIFLNTSSQDSESDNFYIKIYDTVHLENGEILRASDSYQNKKWFSNVAVSAAEDQDQYESDEGIWD